MASTAGGAVLGGVGAYWGSGGASSRSSSSMPKVKVKAWVKNDVIDLPRIGSALKNDTYHSFSNVIDNYVGYANKSMLNNATLYQLQGSLNGVAGRFEWIVQNQQVTHRMFAPGGGVNGIPIMP